MTEIPIRRREQPLVHMHGDGQCPPNAMHFPGPRTCDCPPGNQPHTVVRIEPAALLAVLESVINPDDTGAEQVLARKATDMVLVAAGVLDCHACGEPLPHRGGAACRAERAS